MDVSTPHRPAIAAGAEASAVLVSRGTHPQFAAQALKKSGNSTPQRKRYLSLVSISTPTKQNNQELLLHKINREVQL